MADRIVVGITGASGAAYAKRLIECLARAKVETHLIISPHGRRLIAEELGIAHLTVEALAGESPAGAVTIHQYNDVGALPASGSFLTDGMIVCPCSSNMLGEIASGVAANLIARAAMVHLKESRRLVLLTREMPVSRIEIENMLRVSSAGGIICPASPGFYLLPKRVEDLVDFVVGKLLDLIGVAHSLPTRWAPPST
jgi:4-hydroxy-3-polyprenylbenzoate decarboxylase